MTTNTTNSQAPEILAKQVAEWRKEVARLNDLIAHAEGRDSQAASIADDEKFVDLVYWYDRDRENQKRLFEYVDSLIKQAREEGEAKAYKTYDTAMETGGQWLEKWQARAIAAEALAEKAEQYTQVALGIKDSLEARLAEIQRGVEGLTRYTPGLRWGVTGFEGGLSLVSRNEILALLQPQGQADTSGLPG